MYIVSLTGGRACNPQKAFCFHQKKQKLDMEKTLEENNVVDESNDFCLMGLPDDYYVPAIHLYFNDDLTVA